MITAFFRTAILYLLLIVGLRLTGKRQIGELEPIELVLTMLLSDLASVPMQDFGIPLVNGVIPIVTLLAMSMLLSCVSLRNVRFRTLGTSDCRIDISCFQFSSLWHMVVDRCLFLRVDDHWFVIHFFDLQWLTFSPVTLLL